MFHVFVYGSLMRGFHNHDLLKTSSFVSHAKVEGFSLHSLGAFPAIVPSPHTDSIVRGEVYEVDGPTLQTLDLLEGHPTFYERNTRQVWVENVNAYLPCYLYIFQHEAEELIPSGSWRHATEVYEA